MQLLVFLAQPYHPQVPLFSPSSPSGPTDSQAAFLLLRYAGVPTTSLITLPKVGCKWVQPSPYFASTWPASLGDPCSASHY